jgi:tRNA (adenine57-N1/adenine58-N1)-methyltransferase
MIDLPSPARGRLRAGDPVVFVERKGRTYHAVLQPGATTNFSGSVLPHDDVIGQVDGVRVRSQSTGKYFFVVRASLVDHALRMTRSATIVYPKDVALLVTWADVGAGDRVVEGGLGTGALAMALLRAVGPTGHVTSYELREDAAIRAQRNIAAFLGPIDHHDVRIASLYEGIAERDVDRVVLDVPEPWEVIPHAREALRPGGAFAAYVPTTLQLQRLVLGLEKARSFTRIESYEVLLRGWHVTGRSVRPQQHMVGHTGFLVFARRVVAPDLPPRAERDEAAEPDED